MSFKKIQLIRPQDIGCPDPGHIYLGRDDIGIWEKFEDCSWHYLTWGADTGTSGTSGKDGTSGVDGSFFGSSGTSGDGGSSGLSGTSGSSGRSGTFGTSGSSGISGTSGTSGTSGKGGTSGTSGTGGTSGSSGIDGTSGSSGIDGTSGSSGTSGTSGSSGSDGIDGGYGGATRKWIYDSSNNPPITPGTVYFNSASLDSITSIRLHKKDADDILVSGWLQSWNLRGVLKIEKREDLSIVGIYSVPSNSLSLIGSNVYEISGLTLYSGSGIAINGNSYLISFLQSDTTELDLRYINPNPTPEKVGGVEAGSTFPVPGKTMQEMWDQLLYPYQYPAFSLFDFIQDSMVEVGFSFSTTTAIWNTTNQDNIEEDSVSISGYNLVTVTGLPKQGSEDLTFTDDVTCSSRCSISWTISGINTRSDIFTKLFTISWQWKFYWGSSANETLTETEVETLQSNGIYSSLARTYNLPANNYKYICFADEYGGPTNFFDYDTGIGVAMYSGPGYDYNDNGYNYALVSVTNIHGMTTDYRVYRTVNKIGDSFSIVVY